MSPYLCDQAQLKRLGHIREQLLIKVKSYKQAATRARNSDNTADGERIARRNEDLATENLLDAELIGNIIVGMEEG